MSDLPVEADPRIYLDIDGVILADSPLFETVPVNDMMIGAYPPELVTRLGNTCLDLVWLSGWGDYALGMAEAINALRGGRVLGQGRDRFDDSIATKTLSLIRDQEASPSPFVWVEDEVTPEASAAVTALSDRLVVPKLIIRPDSETGLNEDELRQIEAFAAEHKVL